MMNLNMTTEANILSCLIYEERTVMGVCDRLGLETTHTILNRVGEILDELVVEGKVKMIEWNRTKYYRSIGGKR